MLAFDRFWFTPAGSESDGVVARRASRGKQRPKQVLCSDDSEIEEIVTNKDSRNAPGEQGSRQKAPSADSAIVLDSDGEEDVSLVQQSSARKHPICDADKGKGRPAIPRDAGGMCMEIELLSYANEVP